MTEVLRDPAQMFSPVTVETTHRADGSLILRSKSALRTPARCVGEYLERWALTAPERPFLMERGASGAWGGVSYGEAFERMSHVASALLELRLSPERPVVILSENSIEHALLTLAAMHVGIPVAPISPAYSLQCRDFNKLESIVETLDPGLIYVADPERFANALQAIEPMHTAALIVASGNGRGNARGFECLLSIPPDPVAIERAFAQLGPDTVAKLMFTSGSTREPKAVINTHRMLCANQQAISQIWPFLSDAPVLVDWLPWHHTFGGNHNFNLVLKNGGTLYIDGGRPVPGQFEQSLNNLAEVSPTLFFNVPRGYDLLVKALQVDATLRSQFFRRVQLLFYAAASLPQDVWEALEKITVETVGQRIPLVSSWGLTETAPMATSCHYQATCSGVVGVPIPGCELKLVPTGNKLEARVKGPNVTPGYFKRSDLTALAFDAEGYFMTGDAVRFVDEKRPELGLCFDGRLGEDFKLLTGTWVSVGALRLEAIAALAPIAQDVVVSGHDRDEIGFLIFPSLEACRRLVDPALQLSTPELLRHPAVRGHVALGLQSLRAKGGGSSTFAARALLLALPPSVDAGEITDKGYINQRIVLSRRAALVERLYQTPTDVEVIVPPHVNPAPPRPAGARHLIDT